ncbi:MAG: sigma-54-dependent Fis family transcriptional regulator [Candidatus Electrothrix sp. AUS1_2]|nr:sigma-54-dependent Fis family transcriptional regulator [Candidatus Electrothrix sp. AUS1_2]
MNSAAVYSCGYAGSSTIEKCLGALQDAGLRAERNSDGGRQLCSILFFDEPSDDICHLLRKNSDGGRNRVLAISLSRTLKTGETDRLLANGAADVLAWNETYRKNLAFTIKARFDRWGEVDKLLGSTLVRERLVGTSSCWKNQLRELVEGARFTDFPILLTGESGTGKELAANLVHELDPCFGKGDLVVVDCTTLTPELAGSELFGHERGAFTGAASQRDGAVSQADNGTLFLDEVGELPLPLQAQLLRVLQEGTYKRVGGNTWQKAKFRLVCATNRNLEEEVGQGRFRADLYFRIAGLLCELPPLRNRSGDILPLARHFIRQICPDREPPKMDEPVKNYFLQCNYPGNVRELRQRVMRVMHRYAGGGILGIGSIPPDERIAAPRDGLEAGVEHAIRRALFLGKGLKKIGQTAEELAVRIALEDAGGSLQKAAQILGITDRALQMRRAKERQARAAAFIQPVQSV